MQVYYPEEADMATRPLMVTANFIDGYYSRLDSIPRKLEGITSISLPWPRNGSYMYSYVTPKKLMWLKDLWTNSQIYRWGLLARSLRLEKGTRNYIDFIAMTEEWFMHVPDPKEADMPRRPLINQLKILLNLYEFSYFTSNAKIPPTHQVQIKQSVVLRAYPLN